MKIRPIFGFWPLRFAGIKAITLYPFIFFRYSSLYYLMYDPNVLKHEMIHVEQIRRVGFFKFYLTYPFRHRRYEGEAYEREGYALTLNERRELGL
jgi:hypothetical protein